MVPRCELLLSTFRLEVEIPISKVSVPRRFLDCLLDGLTVYGKEIGSGVGFIRCRPFYGYQLDGDSNGFTEI